MLRFFRVADARLEGRDWLAGELSIADFALYPVVAVRKPQLEAAGGPAESRALERGARCAARYSKGYESAD